MLIGNKNSLWGKEVIETPIGLTHYYPFDTDSNDAIGVLDGTDNNVQYLGDGVDFTLNGVNYVSLPDNDDFSFTDGVNDKAFSISLIKDANAPMSTSGNWYVQKRSEASGSLLKEWQLYHYNGFLVFNLLDQSTGGRIAIEYEISEVDIAGKKHIAATYDGSKSHTGLGLYLDGISVGTNFLYGTYNGMENQSANVILGCQAWNKSFGVVNGIEKGLGFWNKNLTPSEVDIIKVKQLDNDLQLV